MLNSNEESGIEGDELYFPEVDKVFAFGDYEVSTLAIMEDDFKIFRRIQIKKHLKDPLLIDHYQVKNWHDKGINLHSRKEEFTNFLRVTLKLQ